MRDRLWPKGVLRVPAGTCPGCARASHPGTTCNGRTFAQAFAAARRLPGAVYVPLDDRR